MKKVRTFAVFLVSLAWLDILFTTPSEPVGIKVLFSVLMLVLYWRLYIERFSWQYLLKQEQWKRSSSDTALRQYKRLSKVIDTGIYEDGGKVIVNIDDLKSETVYFGSWTVYFVPGINMKLYRNNFQITDCWHYLITGTPSELIVY
jgi:hypothetical protein